MSKLFQHDPVARQLATAGEQVSSVRDSLDFAREICPDSQQGSLTRLVLLADQLSTAIKALQ